MTVKEFIDGANKAKNVDEYIEKHIVNKYIGYAEKIAKCESIVDATSKMKAGDEEFFRVNSPAKFLLYSLNLINSYTDIEIDFQNPIECFDELESTGLASGIVSKIPQQETISFQMILKMVSDDLYENERSIVGYFSTKIKALNQIFETVMDEIQTGEEDNE